MSKTVTRKIGLMASHDWTLRLPGHWRSFLDYLDPTIKWDGKNYKIELVRIIAKPLRVGSDLSKTADLIVDRTSHWNPYYRSWAHQAVNSQARMVNHAYTFAVYDKHSTFDLMSLAMHPADRFHRNRVAASISPLDRGSAQRSLVAVGTRTYSGKHRIRF